MKNKVLIEIRRGEGGQDASLLVKDMAGVYLRSARINNFSSSIKEERDGFCLIWIEGKDVLKFYKNESGKHTFQRVPPTESKGRLHTSVITVAVMTEEDNSFVFDKKDVIKNYTRSQGNGGQNINKVESCVHLRHIPTGIIVKCQDTKHQAKNEVIAWKRLEDKLLEIHKNKSYNEEKKERWDQIGNGGRSDKKRTYRFKDDIVIDHETNKTAKLSKFLKGNIQLLK